MVIALRYVFRTVLARKLRTALLVLSVGVSAALYFASTALTTSLTGMYADRLQETYGNAEIVVEPHPRGWSSLVLPGMVQDAGEGIEYAIGVFEGAAVYRRHDTAMPMSLTAVAFQDLVKMDRMSLAAEDRLLPFRGHKAIVGSHTAAAHDIAAGDYVRLEILGTVYRFRVAGIAHPAGMFIEDAESPAVVVPRDFMAALYGARGHVETIYVKAEDGQDKQRLIERLERVFRRNRVRESVSAREAREWTRELTVPLQIMLVLVLLTAGFIKHTAFQVIVLERLPVIGTFRSVGATRRITSAVLFLESVLYGGAGGVVGCALGIGALYLVARWSTPAWLAEDGIRIAFSAGQLASTVLVAVGLALASSAIPIIRASRIPIKALLLGGHQSKQRSIGRLSTVGAVLVALAVIVPTLAPSLLNAVAGIVAGVVGIVRLAPLALTGAAAAVSLVAAGSRPGAVAELAAANLRGNRYAQNSVALLSIGIGSMLMINTISSSVMDGLARDQRDMRYDVELWTWYMDRATARRAHTVDGVRDVLGMYGLSRVPVADSAEDIDMIHGVRADRFPEFWRLRGSDDGDRLYSQLDRERTIIPTYALQKRLDLVTGDTITLELARGRRDYRVIGFFHSMSWDGSYALIGERFLKHDGLQRWYDALYVQADRDADAVEAGIRQRFNRRDPWVRTVAEIMENTRQRNRELLRGLQGFAFMALAIAVIGVVNNQLIAFIERRRSLALYRSVGMEQGQMVHMVLIEALICGTVGGLIGVGSALLLLYIADYVIRALEMYVLIRYSAALIAVFFLVGVAATVLASVSPALKARRIDLLREIRHE